MPRRRPPLSPEAAAVLRALAASRAGLRSLPPVRARRRRRPRARRPARRVRHKAAEPPGSRRPAAAPRRPAAPGPPPRADRSDTEKVVNWANWTLYLDIRRRARPTRPSRPSRRRPASRRPTPRTSRTTTPTTARSRPSSSRARTSARTSSSSPTGWPAALIRPGLRAEARRGARSRTRRTSCRRSQNVSFDPGRQYSLTWQSGFAGLAYNKDQGARPVKTVDDLWRPDLKGRVEVLSERRDTLGLIMLQPGHRHRQAVHPGAVRQGAGGAREAAQQRPDPPGQGQLLQGGPDQRGRRWP